MSDAAEKAEKSGHEPRKNSVLSFFKGIRLPPAASITAITVTVLGFLGNDALKRHDQANLFAQLVAQREQSASALRMDMFRSMISMFFQQQENDGGAEYFLKRMLQLEMLALNFGEYMTMGPLFHELATEIRIAKNRETLPEDKAYLYLEKLEVLASRVSSWQLAALPKDEREDKRQLDRFTMTWDFKEIGMSEAYSLRPESSDKLEKADFSGANFSLDKADADFSDFKEDRHDKFAFTQPNVQTKDDEQPLSDDTKRPFGPKINGRKKSAPMISEKKNKAAKVKVEKYYRPIVLGDVKRFIHIELYGADLQMKTLNAKVRIKEQEIGGKAQILDYPLSFFRFPMVDNIRLPHDHRLALVLKKFDRKKIEATVLIFPGMYGSQRDKPFLDVIMQQLPKLADQN